MTGRTLLIFPQGFTAPDPAATVDPCHDDAIRTSLSAGQPSCWPAEPGLRVQRIWRFGASMLFAPLAGGVTTSVGAVCWTGPVWPATSSHRNAELAAPSFHAAGQAVADHQ